jgi:hypothetical protein
MKVLVAVLGIILLVAPVAAEAAVRTSARTKATSKIDYNCSDFSTHQQAQDFFINSGGPSRDPYRLDGDKDGIACENLYK